jgi:integral membrane protein
MKKYFISSVGRLRLYAFLEGVSLLVLLFIAMPVKYLMEDPSWVKVIGPIHGALFLLFVFGAITVGVEEKWKFRTTTWIVLLASFIPFGTFYIDWKIFRHLKPAA